MRVELDDALIESNQAETKFPKIMPLMSSKEKLKCQNIKAVLRYHHPSPQKRNEQYFNHLLFAFYPFRHEVHLKSHSNTGTYFAKSQKPGVMEIITRNKSLIEPFGEMVEEALLNCLLM